MVSVVPKFQQVFQDLMNGRPLPAITQYVMGASEWVQEHYVTALVAVAVVVAAKKVVGKTQQGTAILFK